MSLSQEIGNNYKSLIPTLSDEATIVEAFQFYHYGVDPYTGTVNPTKSIEGHLSAINVRADGLNTRLTSAEGNIVSIQNTINNTLPTVYVEQVSLTLNPNVISPQTSATIPLAITGVSGQIANLQEWRNNTGTVLSSVNSSGKFFIRETVTVNGISGQTSNLQEWKNNGGTNLSWVDKDGKFWYQGTIGPELIGEGQISSMLLMGA
jgi:hypothetical protein